MHIQDHSNNVLHMSYGLEAIQEAILIVGDMNSFKLYFAVPACSGLVPYLEIQPVVVFLVS